MNATETPNGGSLQPDGSADTSSKQPLELRCVWCDFPLTNTFKLWPQGYQSGWCRACRMRV